MKLLSIEQMNKLKELGVDVLPKGLCFMYSEVVPVECRLMYAESFCEDDMSAFSLQDVIELLPKTIRDYELNWYISSMIFRYDYFNSFGGFDVLDNASFSFNENVDIIDAAYEMLIWVIENGYLKTNTDENN